MRFPESVQDDPRNWPPPVRNRLVKRAALWALGIRERLGAGRSVLLTFDDGPDPDVTPAVLRLLRGARARAVFFVVGSRAEMHPQLLRQAVAEGHLVGNHTWSHDPGGRFAFLPYLEDVARCQAAAARALGKKPSLFRPPEGKLSVGSIGAPAALGLRSVYWSLDPRDYLLETGEQAADCACSLARCCRPGDILLLHDTNPLLPAVLGPLLQGLARRGMDLSAGVRRLA